VIEDTEEVEVGPDPREDIAEQKALVATLKAAKEAAETNGSHITPVAVKRPYEEETQLTLNIAKNAEASTLPSERPIASNRRILMTPNRKAALWGTLAFSIGLGAVAFLPSLL